MSKKGYLTATNEAYHAARGRLEAAIHRQLRHIEKTGRPDPEIGKEIGEEKCTVECLAWIIHKFSAAVPESSVLTALRSVGLLDVP